MLHPWILDSNHNLFCCNPPPYVRLFDTRRCTSSYLERKQAARRRFVVSETKVAGSASNQAGRKGSGASRVGQYFVLAVMMLVGQAAAKTKSNEIVGVLWVLGIP